MAMQYQVFAASNSEHTHYLLVGKFNYKDIDWKNEYVYQSGIRDNSSGMGT